MIVDPRLRASYALAVALALGACAAPASDASGALNLDANDDVEIVARKRPPPPPPADAGVKPDARPPDACTGGGDPTSPGVISCATGGDPSATCSLPTQCCFSNYSAQHDGECTTSTCTWGAVSCDGPEDCADGERCCANVIIDAEWGILGYRLACQASACGAAPVSEELCHPTTSSDAGTCTTGTACVTASGHDYDLPPTLHICR